MAPNLQLPLFWYSTRSEAVTEQGPTAHSKAYQELNGVNHLSEISEFHEKGLVPCCVVNPFFNEDSRWCSNFSMKAHMIEVLEGMSS